MRSITPREREVHAPALREDLTQAEIGEQIGVFFGQMQVSRIIRSRCPPRSVRERSRGP